MKALSQLPCLLLSGLMLSPAFADVPSTLTLPDLRNHAERWPAAIAVPADLQFQSGATVKKGEVVKVADFDGRQVVVDNGHGLVFGLPVAETDFLARANEAWAGLTPEQRAIDATTLAADRTLWPVKVRTSAEFRLGNGTAIKPGGEYEVLSVGADGVKLLAADYNTTLKTSLQSTDLIPRARALVLVAPAKRPSRIAANLRGHLVDAAGKAVDPAGLEDTQVFALYYGASWCGPCRAFSPDLVKFVNRVAPQNPRLTAVLMSSDKTDAAMYGYMKEAQMPWLAMPKSALVMSPALVSYTKGGIPQLVVVDRHGQVLADSFQGTNYLGPRVAMERLESILETGVAR